MAYKNTNTRYEFSAGDKASMIIILEQFPEHMETIHELKNMLMVDGAIVLDSHYAVLLACLVAEYHPQYSERLMRPIETLPAMSPAQWAARHHELASR